MPLPPTHTPVILGLDPRIVQGLHPRMPFYVYIVANEARTLYIGVTNDLARRVEEHRTAARQGFTSRYKLGRLVWFETFDRVVDAIAHEKRLKRWNRAWKLELIEKSNPGWEDLTPP